MRRRLTHRVGRLSERRRVIGSHAIHDGCAGGNQTIGTGAGVVDGSVAPKRHDALAEGRMGAVKIVADGAILADREKIPERRTAASDSVDRTCLRGVIN